MYKSLQSARAVAALLVMLFHLGKAIADEKYFGLDVAAAPFLFGGVAGVDFFFVLSGFIIYYIHHADISKPHRLGNYVYKRVTRIFPTYWLIFFAIYLTARALPAFSHTVPHDIWVALQAALLVPQDPEVVGSMGSPVLMVAWSLQYEMLFYFLFALAIYDRRLGITAVAVVMCIYVYGKSLDEVEFPLSFLVIDRLWLFVMGMVAAAFCARHKPELLAARSLFLVGLGIFLTVGLDFNLHSNLFTGYYSLAYGLASMLLVIGMIGMEDQGVTLLGGKFFQLLGNSSYALYLLHFPLISITCKVMVGLGFASLGTLGAVLTFAIAAAVCIACSALFYLVMERPLAVYLRKRQRRQI